MYHILCLYYRFTFDDVNDDSRFSVLSQMNLGKGDSELITMNTCQP